MLNRKSWISPFGRWLLAELSSVARHDPKLAGQGLRPVSVPCLCRGWHLSKPLVKPCGPTMLRPRE